MIRHAFERVAHEERGAVMVIFAAFIPVFIVIAAFVIEIADGMEHRRQLQLQADAGALAAGQEFLHCRTDPAAANTVIKDVAEDYATGKNSLFPGTDAADRLEFAVNDDPCGDKFVDVTLTEHNAPDFFSTDTDEYSADARVKIFALQSLNSLLPLAVPVPDPDGVEAVFVDETSGLELERADLVKGTAANGLDIWETDDPVEVSIPSEHVGVRICTDDAVSTCYDAGSARGLVHIRGWSTAGTVTQNLSDGLTKPAILRSVALEPATPACEDARFNPSFSPAAPLCDAAKRQVIVNALVDFGGNPANVIGKVWANIGGADIPLTFAAGTPWAASAPISIPSAEGPLNITIKWEAQKGKLPTNNPNKPDVCNDKNNNPCKWNLPNAQRHFRTSETGSGPIELVEVSEEDGADHANSLQQGLHDLNVKVGIAGTLQAGGAHYLRMSQDSGSQTQTLDCNAAGGNEVELQILNGCDPFYKVNDEGIDCPDDISSLPTPWPCVEVSTGDAESQVARALNLRILGDEKPTAADCPDEGEPGYNNWPDYSAGDKRLVYVFQTDLGAFGTGGNVHSVSITGLRAFYITGWQGPPGFNNPCNVDPELPLGVADVIGHYVADLKLPNDGGAGPGACNFNGLQPCTPVLVD